MRKENKEAQLNIEKPAFSIFQFTKIEGIRGKKTYKKDHFVSPIFGHQVKDIVTVPFTVKSSGDTTRKFDAFRTKHKMSDQEAIDKYGTKYYEFSNIVSNKTRSEYFGPSDFVPSDKPPKEEVKKPKMMNPIGSNHKKALMEEKKDNHMAFKAGKVEPERRIIQPKPEYSPQPKVTREPKPEIFKREKSKPKPVVTSEFGFLDDKEEIVKETYVYPESNQNQSYQFPKISMFSKKDRDLNEQPQWLLDQIDVINATLQQFGIEGKVKSSRKGPTVTRYEIALEPGVNVKRVSAISDNLMMSLASKSLRIEAPIPGKPYVGLEVPNKTPEIVAFGNVIDNPEFLNDKAHPLKVALGVDIDGESIYADIQAMPHGLIAGATNSGISVFAASV